ncbi:MAG: peptidoglycan-binding protein [Actinomycetota bacterium]|jgi:peptidoglycan hydrolase-like protein with peptidoglycan-binding domain
MPTADDFIKAAIADLGTAESPANSNRIRYWDDIGRPNLQGQPWCGAFVTAKARQVGLGDQVDYIYCPAGRTTFAKRNRLFTTPEPGDLCFFEFDADMLVDHTGIVVKINGDGTILAIEGNTRLAGQRNDSVCYRTRPLSVCRGFGRPEFSSSPVAPTVAGPVDQPAGDCPGTRWFRANHPQVGQGARGTAVAHLQGLLGVTADGDFGPQTAEAVRRAQSRAGIAVDGICGPDTWSHLHPTLQKGAEGPAVQEVQHEVACPVDGIFGGMTDAQVRNFQRTHRITADGIVGPQTYGVMFR